MLLQSKLANVSMTFKDVLEVRTQVCRRLQHVLTWCSLRRPVEHEGVKGPDRAIHALHHIRGKLGSDEYVSLLFLSQ